MGVNEVTAAFVNVLIKNNRLSGLEDVLRAFLDMAKAADGQLDGTITSAHPLSDEHFKLISKQVDQMTKKVLGAGSQSVSLTRKVDPGIFLVFFFCFGNYQLDLSGHTHITRLCR